MGFTVLIKGDKEKMTLIKVCKVPL